MLASSFLEDNDKILRSLKRIPYRGFAEVLAERLRETTCELIETQARFSLSRLHPRRLLMGLRRLMR